MNDPLLRAIYEAADALAKQVERLTERVESLELRSWGYEDEE